MNTGVLSIWVLTGDKVEAAINIAVACNLLAPPAFMAQIIVDSKSASGRDEMLSLFDRELKVSGKVLHSGNVIIFFVCTR